MGEIGVPGLARGLIGRARELELLAGLLAEAAAGHGTAVLIEGEPASASRRSFAPRWRVGPSAARCSGALATSWTRRCRSSR